MIRRADDQIYGHTGVPDLIRIFEGHTSHIIFTHLGNWFVKDTREGRKRLRFYLSDRDEFLNALLRDKKEAAVLSIRINRKKSYYG